LTPSVVLSAVVGAALLFAGIMKLVDRRSFAVGATALGVPATVAASVPWVEVLLGSALVLDIGGVAAHVGTLALLLAFTALLVVNLLRGNRPACACFGARAATPISWWTVSRNGVLLALIVAALLVA
jgi:hypothetical protein